MAIYFNILALRIPWTEEPGGLQPEGLQRAGHDLVTKPLPPAPLGFSLYTHYPLGYISPFPLPTISNTNARSLWIQVTLLPWTLVFRTVYNSEDMAHNGKGRAHLFQVCWLISLSPLGNFPFPLVKWEMVSCGVALHQSQAELTNKVDKTFGLSPHSCRPVKLN